MPSRIPLWWWEQSFRENGGDAFVSAGNTGALLTVATPAAKRIKGIKRAAISPVCPTETGSCVILDAGANNDCTPEYLLQFAYMGAFYAEKYLGKKNPKVGLLNNGAEETKGRELQREAYALLKAAGDAGHLNFGGNVEARQVPLGDVDVVVWRWLFRQHPAQEHRGYCHLYGPQA